MGISVLTARYHGVVSNVNNGLVTNHVFTFDWHSLQGERNEFCAS